MTEVYLSDLNMLPSTLLTESYSIYVRKKCVFKDSENFFSVVSTDTHFGYIGNIIKKMSALLLFVVIQ